MANDNRPELNAVCKGISRMGDNANALLLHFDRRPTDDEMRAVHEVVKEAALCEPCDVCGMMVDKTADACRHCG